jgi:hypothetical protein
MEISLTRSVRRKDERGESLMGITMVLASGLMFLTFAFAGPAFIRDAIEARDWGDAASVLEKKCGLEDVQLDSGEDKSSNKPTSFTSSSDDSAKYTLEAVGVNLVVRDDGNELCTVSTNLQDFR